ncbi:hypothetical protein MMC25_004098 [Agyrium rufum]|nr:hypothetical protein [Agyrium rufum]
MATTRSNDVYIDSNATHWSKVLFFSALDWLAILSIFQPILIALASPISKTSVLKANICMIFLTAIVTAFTFIIHLRIVGRNARNPMSLAHREHERSNIRRWLLSVWILWSIPFVLGAFYVQSWTRCSSSTGMDGLQQRLPCFIALTTWYLNLFTILLVVPLAIKLLYAVDDPFCRFYLWSKPRQIPRQAERRWTMNFSDRSFSNASLSESAIIGPSRSTYSEETFVDSTNAYKDLPPALPPHVYTPKRDLKTDMLASSFLFGSSPLDNRSPLSSNPSSVTLHDSNHRSWCHETSSNASGSTSGSVVRHPRTRNFNESRTSSPMSVTVLPNGSPVAKSHRSKPRLPPPNFKRSTLDDEMALLFRIASNESIPKMPDLASSASLASLQAASSKKSPMNTASTASLRQVRAGLGHSPSGSTNSAHRKYSRPPSRATVQPARQQYSTLPLPHRQHPHLERDGLRANQEVKVHHWEREARWAWTDG